MAEGRCMKCKKQVEIKDAKEIEMKRWFIIPYYGRRALQGVCPDCGTKVFRMLGKIKAEATIPITSVTVEPVNEVNKDIIA